MDRFCHAFMLDQHMKRHAKSSSQKHVAVEARSAATSDADCDSRMITVVGPRMQTLYLRTA
jgi:cellobiose-specific phosphotransferase system component IIB